MYELPDRGPAGAVLIACSILAAGCGSSARRLDPEHAGEEYLAGMKFRFQPGVTDPAILKQIQPGDIIAFSSGEDSGGSSTVLGMALSRVSHVAIVFPFYHGKVRVLSADSEQGVYIDTVENCVRGRNFFDFAFPPGLLVPERLTMFAERAVFLGRLDYDWSAMFGMNCNLTPNTLPEIGDEYTCATAVSAALHFAGLSLDRAWWGVVTPADIVFSVARRNVNGLRLPTVGAAGERPPREAER
jgi:hypothetical protein